MELLSNSILSEWLDLYGSWGLFALLALEIVALPIPGETLMVLAGIFMHSNNLSPLPTILAAFIGTCLGITISYLLGRQAGATVVKKYGSRIGLTPERITKVHDWFLQRGKWTIPLGYFIPGVRHFTGICAGMSDLEYHAFATYAYGGAFVWVTTFLSIGYFFGNYWLQLIEKISLYFFV